MNFYKYAALLLIISSLVFAQDKSLVKEDLKTQDQKVSYSIGHDIGKNFQMQGMEISINEFTKGIQDGMSGNSLLTEEEIYMVLTQYQQEMTAKFESKNKALAEINIKEGEDYLAANKIKEGVLTTESGLQYKVIKKGNGPKPAVTDTVTVHYKGYFINGETFDSSYDRNEPITYPVSGFVPGWTEALQLMNVGDKLELAIPYNIAYGERGKSPIVEPYKTLLFEIELIDIVK